VPKFHTRLTAGGKPPYDTWAFVVVRARKYPGQR
jgi:hypothetical protein